MRRRLRCTGDRFFFFRVFFSLFYPPPPSAAVSHVSILTSCHLLPVYIRDRVYEEIPLETATEMLVQRMRKRGRLRARHCFPLLQISPQTWLTTEIPFTYYIIQIPVCIRVHIYNVVSRTSSNIYIYTYHVYHGYRTCIWLNVLVDGRLIFIDASSEIFTGDDW